MAVLSEGLGQIYASAAEAPFIPLIAIREPDPAMCTVPCFTPGTSICTSKGLCLVENLEVGDRVLTRDNGFKPIVWTGIKRVEGTQLKENSALQPIFIQRGSLGEDCPNRDIMVSRQHRMLVTGDQCELFFGSNEVLVKAHNLVSKPGVSEGQIAGVTYVHIMFDEHEIVLANDVWTESFQPDDSSVTGFDEIYIEELNLIFPELPGESRFAYYGAARLMLKSHEAAVLLA